MMIKTITKQRLNHLFSSLQDEQIHFLSSQDYDISCISILAEHRNYNYARLYIDGEKTVTRCTLITQSDNKTVICLLIDADFHSFEIKKKRLCETNITENSLII